MILGIKPSVSQGKMNFFISSILKNITLQGPYSDFVQAFLPSQNGCILKLLTKSKSCIFTQKYVNPGKVTNVIPYGSL